MSQTIEEKNKALVLKAFDTCLTSVTTRPLRSIGRPIISSTAHISNRVAMGCSI
jgi:hypothetical protein